MRILTKSFRRMKEKGDKPGITGLITANWKENAPVNKKPTGKRIDSIEKCFDISLVRCIFGFGPLM